MNEELLKKDENEQLVRKYRKEHKYSGYYCFSEDREEVEITITAKKIGDNYVFQKPESWSWNNEVVVVRF